MVFSSPGASSTGTAKAAQARPLPGISPLPQAPVRPPPRGEQPAGAGEGGDFVLIAGDGDRDPGEGVVERNRPGSARRA